MPAISTTSPAPHKLEVLVVDDDADNLDSTAFLLEKCGVVVTTAKGGKAAIAQINAHCPDVVLLDLAMPDVSGYEVAQTIRQSVSSDRPLLVALTGYGETGSKHRSAECGFDLHFTKPVDFSIVAELLRSLGALREQARELAETHRAVRTVLVQSYVEMAFTLLEVAASSLNVETQSRALGKAASICQKVSTFIEKYELADLREDLNRLEKQLSK